MKQVVDNGLLPAKYFFIGDEAFSNTPQLLVPYSGTGIGTAKDSFNYHLSSIVLTKRWGIFWRPLTCAYDRWALVCTTAAKLHNFCIKESVPVPDEVHPSSLQVGDVWEGIENGSQRDPEFKRALIGDRRKIITEDLQLGGFVRPLLLFATVKRDL